MKNTYFSAKMIDYNTIKVVIFSNINKDDKTPIELFDKKGKLEKLNIINKSFLNGLVLYECKSKTKLNLGNAYYISISSFGMVPLDVNDLALNKDFDDEFYYDGNDLGCNYSKEKTTFKLWAPLANKVSLLIKKEGENFNSYKMTRSDKGIYEITLNGDYELYLYRYQVTNSGITNIVTDPYAKGSDANGKNSVVIDLNKTKMDLFEINDNKYTQNVDKIIYELHVRDFTIDPSIKVKNKGKFLGLIEEGIKTRGGHLAGFDYLKSLGITHVQLLPVLDYKTVNELNPDEKYNWGYDPQQYFALEGSFSTNPNDPYSRIIEFKKMIQAFHKAGLRINLDVVYNHVYEIETSVFERIVPNYYFRRQKNGLLCNATGCGNDLASERKMVRKLIIDSLTYLLDEFKVDGFRFDLFGITDLETTYEIEKKLRSMKKDIMIYGEGWDMPTELNHDNKTTIYNSFKIPYVAFFNDFYRDSVRGSNFGGNKGYLLGNTSLIENFKFSYLGSVIKHANFNPRFLSLNQSINYAECHDNKTLFDVIDEQLGKNYPLKEKLRILNLVNGSIDLSIGIPFFHAGQEIGLSKFHEDNTYNMGDKYNMFRWDLVDIRFDNYLYFKSLNEYRRDSILNKICTKEDLMKRYQFVDFDNDVFGVILRDIELNNELDKKEYLILINPTSENKYIDLKEYYKCIIGLAGELKNSDIYCKNIRLEPHFINAFYKKGNK